VREADAPRAFVADFIETVKRDSFARLPGIRAATPPP
jgi:LysR family transcriptional regulator for metE and metH